MVEPMNIDPKDLYIRGFPSAYSDGVKVLGSFLGKFLATRILFRHLSNCHSLKETGHSIRAIYQSLRLAHVLMLP